MPLEQVHAETAHWRDGMSRKEATAALRGQPTGTFVLRPSSQDNCIAVSSVQADGSVGHGLIMMQGNMWRIDGDSDSYESLRKLLQSCNKLTYT